MNEPEKSSSRIPLMLGALVMAAAVGLGAIGSHSLETYLNRGLIEQGESENVSSDAALASRAKRLKNWETGVRYQAYHGLGLMLLGIICRFHRDRLLQLAIVFFIAGILLFSGMLYLWVLTQQKTFVMLVPLGGVSFIVGWICSLLSFMRIR